MLRTHKSSPIGGLYDSQYKQTLAAQGFAVVELGGVEPPSESALTQNSPGADGYFELPRFPHRSASRHAFTVR